MKVPFNKISLSRKEVPYIKEAIKSGHLHGDGPFLKACEKHLRNLTSSDSALLTTSCTSALDISAILANIKEGDEVIVPTFTFVSSINSFVLRGAKPVFCDVEEGTLNIDSRKIEALITPKTKLIVAVHYAGVACDMDYIMQIAKKHNLYVVEDAAQGLLGYYKGKPLGSIGDFGALSFHGTKNVISGEGGALLVNRKDYIQRANYIREKGTNRIDFIEGKIDKYTWIDYGSSYIPSELISAFLLAQLEQAKKFTSKRIKAWNFYNKSLKNLDKAGKISVMKVPEYAEHNAHIYFFLCRDRVEAKSLENHLKGLGIMAFGHYVPLHTCPMAKTLGCDDVSLPVAEDTFDRLIRLPIYTNITRAEQSYVCDAIAEFFLKNL